MKINDIYSVLMIIGILAMWLAFVITKESYIAFCCIMVLILFIHTDIKEYIKKKCGD